LQFEDGLRKAAGVRPDLRDQTLEPLRGAAVLSFEIRHRHQRHVVVGLQGIVQGLAHPFLGLAVHHHARE